MNAEDLTLYLVTCRYDYSDAEFLQKIEVACQNGVTMVQLREKEASTRKFYQLGLAVKSITDAFRIPLIIDDRVDICLALDAAGVHIGDDELPVRTTRRILGPDKIIGVSAKDVPRAVEAQKQGATYLGVGAMFPTTTKENAPHTSIGTLQKIINTVDLPVVAIGGIHSETAPLLKGTKIDGISVVSAIMKAPVVSEAATTLKQQIREIKAK